MGQTFGYVDSPQDWEQFSRARINLPQILSHHRDLLAKHNFIISQVEFSKPPTKGIYFIPDSPNKYHQGAVDKPRFVYNIFVDDSLFVAVAPSIKHAMTGSIEALYIVLRFSDLAARQEPLSLDKYFSPSAPMNAFNLENSSTREE